MTTFSETQPFSLFPSIARELTKQVARSYRMEKRVLPSHLRTQVARIIQRIENGHRAAPEFTQKQIAEFILRDLTLETQRKFYANEYTVTDHLAITTVLTAASLVLAASAEPLEKFSVN